MGGSTIPFPQFNSGVGSNAGANPASIIDELTKSSHSPEEMQRLAAAAATPIPGAHSTATPLNLQPSQIGFTPAPLNHEPTAPGKGNARGQGIGNAIIGVANAITGVTIADKNKKQLQVATDTHTLLTSQQAIDQAQQILQNDPTNQAAQDAIKHNKDVMNGILSDKKTRDAISKGFKIDFTDPQANNTDDHKAVQQGQQMAEKSLSLADQFSKGVPQTMQPNLQAQAKYQQAQIEQKSQAETLRALSPIISAQTRAGAQVTAAQIREQGEAFRAAYTSQQRAALQAQQFQNSQKLIGMRFSAESNLLAQKASAAVKTASQIMDLKDQDPISIMTKSTSALSGLQRTSGEIQSRITAVQQNLDAAKTDGQRNELRQEVEALKRQKESIDSSYMDTKTFFDSLKLKGGSNGTGAASGASDNPSSDDDDDATGDINSLDHYLQP